MTLDFLGTAVRVSIPFSELMGAGFAWHLYHDYMQSQNQKVPNFDPFAKIIKEVPDPEETLPFSGSAGTKDGHKAASDYSAATEATREPAQTGGNDPFATHGGAQQDPFSTHG